MIADNKKIYRGYAAKHFGYFDDFPDITEVWTVSHSGRGSDTFTGYKLFASDGENVVAKYHSIQDEPIEVSISKLKEIITKTKI